MTTVFGYNKPKNLWEKYIGRWVSIYPRGTNHAFSGKMKSIEEDYAILEPFQHTDIVEGKLIRKIIRDDMGILAPLVESTIEPVTEEYLAAWCEYMNKKDEEPQNKK